jgi:hypothetical protein
VFVVCQFAAERVDLRASGGYWREARQRAFEDGELAARCVRPGAVAQDIAVFAAEEAASVDYGAASVDHAAWPSMSAGRGASGAIR